MQIVCLMGAKGSAKKQVERVLEDFGFKRSISYTTRKPMIKDGKLEESGDEYKFVTLDKFMDLVNKGFIIECENYNGEYYGTPIPLGADRFVAVVGVKGFKALREKYGEQVIGVYLETVGMGFDAFTSDENIKADIVIDSTMTIEYTVNEILTKLKGRTDVK